MFLLTFILAQSAQWAAACNISEQDLIMRSKFIQLKNFVPEEESNLSRKDFNRIIDSVKKVYVPIFKSQRMNFRIESQWDDNQVNAFAGTRGSDRYVLLYGGYARHRYMTKDAYLSVICHEIGHHLGGFPKKSSSAWSSSEGQADYFSTLKCMKEVLREDENNKEIALELDLPSEVKKQCSFQFPNANDYYICLRSSKAAEEHGRVIEDIETKGLFSQISLLNPSPEIVSSTNLKHPDSQCRVDTKYQGALCNVSTKIALDDVDETIGSCTFNNFNIIGNRPACWFVHKK